MFTFSRDVQSNVLYCYVWKEGAGCVYKADLSYLQQDLWSSRPRTSRLVSRPRLRPCQQTTRLDCYICWSLVYNCQSRDMGDWPAPLSFHHRTICQFLGDRFPNSVIVSPCSRPPMRRQYTSYHVAPVSGRIWIQEFSHRNLLAPARFVLIH